MRTFNKFLYVISIICVLFTTVLSLMAIWGDAEGVWKGVWTGIIILLACLIMLGINLKILTMRAEIDSKQKSKAEPDSE